ncbi:MAG: ATP-binding protein [Synergistaceae bacterium]|nr:ATP-binding protein [Synergistaceae bacterium]
MLLEFKTKNYKSFVNEMCFSMTPAPKQKGLDYSVLKTKVSKKNYKGLCCGVIYGPNAAGKTNLIGAIDTFKNILLRGNIKNSDSLPSMNAAASVLELIPNCNSPAAPTEFQIRFIDNGMLVDYSITVDLGALMDSKYSRRILEEKLLINEKQIFLRNKFLEVNLPAFIKSNIKKMTQEMQEIAQKSLAATELFLTNGFKMIFAQELVNNIIAWIKQKLIIIYQADYIRISRHFTDSKSDIVEKTLTNAAKLFGITANALGYSTTKEDETLYSLVNGKMIPTEIFESYGTIRFISKFPLIIYVLSNGGTLIVDEFDASIHPMAIMNIINIFHNDYINKKNAQLIFSTQNPIFLDASLLRRDEIKFVDRDDKTGFSKHYALSDFKTANGVRKGEAYMNNYFVNRYGAIKDINFSGFFEEIMGGSNE